jgi:hypothetical protein
MTTSSCPMVNACRWSSFSKSVRPVSMAFSPSTASPTPLPIASPPGQRPQRRGHRDPVHRRPGPMPRNYNDYRRVLIDSANSLARRINE